MYRVLVPIDDDEKRAISQAKYVASLPHSSESVEPLLLFVFTDEGESMPEELRRFKSPDRISSIRRAEEYLEDHGIEAVLLESSGDPGDEIIRAADEKDVEAIVLGGRKRSPVGKAVFGSVTQDVILNSNHPVVVTG